MNFKTSIYPVLSTVLVPGCLLLIGYIHSSQITKLQPNFVYKPTEEDTQERRATSHKSHVDNVTIQTFPRRHAVNISRAFSGGIGNKLFKYASIVGIAHTNKLQLTVLKTFQLLDVFTINTAQLPLMNSINRGLYARFEETSGMKYDKRANNILGYISGKKHVWLDGYYQSFKYFESVERQLRQELQFLPILSKMAQEFLRNVSKEHKKMTTFVGVHVRRGDFISLKGKGYTAATREYFIKAMNYMKTKFSNVHFIVVSNDLTWAKDNLGNDSVTYSPGYSAELDLAILASCNHSIISCGSFSWWAGWLANGITIYYGMFPVPNSFLYNQYKKDDYYPPHWISFT